MAFITIDLTKTTLTTLQKIKIINDYLLNPIFDIKFNINDDVNELYVTFIKLVMKEILTYYRSSNTYSIDIFKEKYNIIITKKDNNDVFFNENFYNFLTNKLKKNKYDLYVTYVNIMHQEILFMFELVDYEIIYPPKILIHIDDNSHQYLGHILHSIRHDYILSFISISKSIYADKNIKVSDILLDEIEKIANDNPIINYMYTLYPFEVMVTQLEKRGFSWMILDGIDGFKDKKDVFAKKIR